MHQTGGMWGKATGTTTRLLPGDRAPELKLDRVFNHEPIFSVRFDRLSVVILWNAGCAGCLPLLSETAEFTNAIDVPCYGVAVYTRDVDRTEKAAHELATSAILALEEQPTQPSVLSRGSVTRNWLEASGQQGVPAGFIVDEKSTVAWIGDPSAIKEVLSDIRAGRWDVQTARKQWAETNTPEYNRILKTVRELTEAMVIRDLASAQAIIDNAEHETPSVVNDRQFILLKLDVLSSLSDREADALAFYSAVADKFGDDEGMQISLAGKIVRGASASKRALQMVIERLGGADGPAPDDPHARIFHLYRWLILAEAQMLAERAAEATALLDRIASFSQAEDLPEHIKADLPRQVERIGNLQVEN